MLAPGRGRALRPGGTPPQPRLLAHTYHPPDSSLLRDKGDFAKQAYQHSDVLWDRFDVCPATFENTEFIYSNEISTRAGQLGFLAACTEVENRFRRDAIAGTFTGIYRGIDP